MTCVLSSFSAQSGNKFGKQEKAGIPGVDFMGNAGRHDRDASGFIRDGYITVYAYTGAGDHFVGFQLVLVGMHPDALVRGNADQMITELSAGIPGSNDVF